MSNIQGAASYLASLPQSGDGRIREHMRIIERQVEEAARLLTAAAAELGRTGDQREEIEFTKSAS